MPLWHIKCLILTGGIEIAKLLSYSPPHFIDTEGEKNEADRSRHKTGNYG